MAACFSSAARITMLKRSTTGLGVALGAKMPLKVTPSTSGYPASAIVGTSGRVAARALPGTAKARSLPLCRCCAASTKLLEADVDMACDQVIDGKRIAAIMHLGPGDAGFELEQLA